MSPQADLDERVTELERIVAKVIERAQAHPAGRKILAYLGISHEG